MQNIVKDQSRSCSTQERNIRGSVLVVDDEPGFCHIIRDILQDSDYIVQEANSVQQALDKLDTFIPDVILVDVMMPQTDGLQLVEQLTRGPDWLSTRIIVISAKVVASNRMASWERGADAFLPKPFMANDLLEVVDYVLSQD